MTTRRRHGEDGISFEHRGPARHRNCPSLWRSELTWSTPATANASATHRTVLIHIDTAAFSQLAN